MQDDTIEAFRLSPQQRRYLLASQSDESDWVQCVVRVSAGATIQTIERVLTEVATRHEILRTCFPRLDGMKLPVQSITQTLPVLRRTELADTGPTGYSRMVAEAAR